jgi:hypothetical protein
MIQGEADKLIIAFLIFVLKASTVVRVRILKGIEIETERAPLFSEAEWFGKCSFYGPLKRPESGLFIEWSLVVCGRTTHKAQGMLTIPTMNSRLVCMLYFTAQC